MGAGGAQLSASKGSRKGCPLGGSSRRGAFA